MGFAGVETAAVTSSGLSTKMSQQQIEQLWEQQTRQAELRRHVVALTTQLNVGERERSVMDVTLRSMSEMPSSTKVYKPIGKMFVLSTKEALKEEFEKGVEDSKKRDDGRVALREQFVKKLQDSEVAAEELAKKIEEARAKARK